MSILLSFLGTAATKPTKLRGASGIYLTLNSGYKLLLDCGEGTLKRIYECGLSPMVDAIFISHSHTDHHWGLLPYLKTMDLNNRKSLLTVYIENTTLPMLVSLINTTGVNLNFPLKMLPANPDKVYQLTEKETLKFFHRVHTVPTVGAIIETAEKVNYNIPKLIEAGIATTGKHLSVGLKEKKLMNKAGDYENIDNFLIKTKSPTLIYTSDGVPIKINALKTFQRVHLIHELTYINSPIAAKSNLHTDFSELDYLDGCPEIEKIYFTHLSEQATTSIKFAKNTLLGFKGALASATIVKDFDQFEIS